MDSIVTDQVAQGLINESQALEKLKQNFKRASEELGESFGVEFVDSFSEALDLPFLGEGFRAAFGDPTAFAKRWAEGFFGGIKNILDGAQLSPFQEEIQGLRLSELDTSQLEQALANNRAQQARLLDGYSETVLQGTVVWESLIASEMALRDQLKAAATSLVDSVAEFLPGFGDQRTPLYNEIGQGLVALGLSVEELKPIIGQFADSSIGELRNLNSTIQAANEKQRGPRFETELDDLSRLDTRDRLGPALSRLAPAVTDIRETVAPDSVLDQIIEKASELGIDNLDQLEVELGDASLSELKSINSQLGRQIEQNERDAEKALKEAKGQNVNLRSVFSLLSSDAETVERFLRAAEDTPLQDYLDNRQAIIRIFSAEKIDAFIVAGTDLAEAQKRQIEEQVLARSAQDELTLLDNLELLLREAGPIDPGDTRLLDVQGLFDEQGVFQGLEGFVDRIREALVADVQEQPVSEAERADIVSDFNVLADALNILPETADAFSTQLAAALHGSLADLEVMTTLDPEAEAGLKDDAEAGIDPDAEVPVEAKTFIDNLRTFFQSSGLPASVYEPFLTALGTALANNSVILKDAAGNALTSIPLVDAAGNDIGTLTLTSTSVELKDAAGNVITSVDLKDAAGNALTSIPLVDAAGNDIGTLTLTTTSVELKDAAGNVITSVDLKDAAGNALTSIPLVDAAGNDIGTIDLTTNSVELKDADGNAITSVELDGTDFLAALEILLAPPPVPETEPPPTQPTTPPGTAPETGDTPSGGGGRRTPTGDGGIGGIDAREQTFLDDTNLLLRAAENTAGGVIKGVQSLIDRLTSVFETDAFTPAQQEAVSGELGSVFDYANILPETTTAFESRLESLFQNEPQVILSDVAVSQLSQAVGAAVGAAVDVEGQTVMVTPSGTGTMEVTTKGVTSVEGAVDANVTGDVNANIPGTVDVRIINTEVFLRETDDATGQRNRFGG